MLAMSKTATFTVRHEDMWQTPVAAGTINPGREN